MLRYYQLKIQIKNILMSMIAAEKSGLKFKKIISTINKVKPVNGRLEQIGIIKNNSTVILDYAHTPVALLTCLENIKEQFKDKNGNIVEIETRGIKTIDGIYFYGKDVEKMLELVSIKDVLHEKTTNYEEGLHYKKFIKTVEKNTGLQSDKTNTSENEVINTYTNNQ